MLLTISWGTILILCLKDLLCWSKKSWRTVIFFLGKLFSLINWSASQSDTHQCSFRLKCSPQQVNLTSLVTSGTHHQRHQFTKLYQSAAIDTLEVKMKGRVAFHEIPEMLALMTWFQRQFVMEGKSRWTPCRNENTFSLQSSRRQH